MKIDAYLDDLKNRLKKHTHWESNRGGSVEIHLDKEGDVCKPSEAAATVSASLYYRSDIEADMKNTRP